MIQDMKTYQQELFDIIKNIVPVDSALHIFSRFHRLLLNYGNVSARQWHKNNYYWIVDQRTGRIHFIKYSGRKQLTNSLFQHRLINIMEVGTSFGAQYAIKGPTNRRVLHIDPRNLIQLNVDMANFGYIELLKEFKVEIENAKLSKI